MALAGEKFIVYHIPKTGGRWIHKAMENGKVDFVVAGVRAGSQPMTPPMMRDHAIPAYVLGKYRVNKFSFCFVRHPIAWYRSMWCFMHKYKPKGAKTDISKMMDGNFDKWVNDVLDKYPDGYVSKLYSYYVQDVDFVGRTVVLPQDLCRALDLSGTEYDAQGILSTPSEDVAGLDDEYGKTAVLSNDTYERILVAERRAFQWCARASMGWLNVEDRCICDGT